MRKPELIPNIALVAALMVAGAACEGRRGVQYAPTGSVSERPQISDKGEKGLRLEALDFSKTEGEKLEKNTSYDVGNLRISFFSENYEVRVNRNELLKYLSQCGADQIRENLSLEISEKVFVPDEKGQMREVTGSISGNGIDVTILLGIDMAYRKAEKELDINFEVDPAKRSQALQNHATIEINTGLVTGLCASAIGSRLDYIGQTRQQAQAEMRKADQFADKYSSNLLTGDASPILQISPKPPQFQAA